ncbi:hypothetical protein Bbelb_154220 [Branchiostoma belcheri]|nr:hypothetical protein Bbelb_154220 [Branchiostoma belcheri]
MEVYNIQDKSTILSVEREDVPSSLKEALLETEPLSDVDRPTFTAPGSQNATDDAVTIMEPTKENISLLQSQIDREADGIEILATEDNVATAEEFLDAKNAEKGEKPTGIKPEWRRKLDTARDKLVFARDRATSAYRVLQHPQPVPEPTPKPEPEQPTEHENKPAWRKAFDFICVFNDRKYNYCCLYIGYGLVAIGVIFILLGVSLLWLYGNKQASSVYGLPIWLGLLLVVVAGLIIANSQWQKDIDDVAVEDEQQKNDVIGALNGACPALEDDPEKANLPDDVIGPFYGACLEETEVLDESGSPVRLTEDEVYASLSEVVSADQLRSIQCIRRLWRLFFRSENAKKHIVTNGIKIRGEQVKVLHYASFTLKKRKTLRRPPTPSPKLVKLTITSLPDSVEDSLLRKGLRDLGCKVKGEVERLCLSYDGQETFCYNGTRVVYVEKTEEVQIRKNMVFCGHRVCVEEENADYHRKEERPGNAPQRFL